VDAWLGSSTDMGVHRNAFELHVSFTSRLSTISNCSLPVHDAAEADGGGEPGKCSSPLNPEDAHRD
jgi:hypothetical protein